MANANNFESLGAHLRNLLTPYVTQIQLIEDMHTAERNGDMDKFNKIKEQLYNTPTDNLNDLNMFSFVEPMEQNNWRETKLFLMEEALKKRQ